MSYDFDWFTPMSQPQTNQMQIKKTHPKNKFTKEEDEMLIKAVASCGKLNWRKISLMLPSRNARQCKDRWENYLDPNLNKTPFTIEEDMLLLEKHQEYGPKWVMISKFFNNRSDTSIKSRYLVLKRRGITLNFLKAFTNPLDSTRKRKRTKKEEKLLAEKIEIQLFYQQNYSKMQFNFNHIGQNKNYVTTKSNKQSKDVMHQSTDEIKQISDQKVNAVAEIPIDIWNDSDFFHSFDVDSLFEPM